MKEENKAVIKALNMYGRVPETWELLKEIEKLNNIINELEKYLRNEEAEYDRLYEEQDEQEYLDKYFATRNVLNKLQELKGSDK